MLRYVVFIFEDSAILPPPQPGYVFPNILDNKHLSFDYRVHPLFYIPTIY